MAAAYGYDEITAELLAAGARADARDHLGNTPLILAAILVEMRRNFD